MKIPFRQFGTSSHHPFAIGAIIWLLLVTGLLAASFQRMRIPGGVHTVRSGGGHIPAICVDPRRDAPMPWNSYGYGSSEIKVTRTEGGKAGPPQSLDYAFKNWLHIEGAGGVGEVNVKPLPGHERAEFRFDVASSGGLIAETSQDGADFWAKLRQRSATLGEADSFLASLEEVLGVQNPLLRELRSYRWEVLDKHLAQIDAEEVPQLLRAALESLRNELAPEDLSDEQRLAWLSLSIGEKPTDGMLKKLRQLTGREIASDLSGDFAPAWKSFTEKQKALQSVFIGDDRLISRFRTSAKTRLFRSPSEKSNDLGDVLSDFNLTEAAAETLIRGKPFTHEQLTVLRTLGANVPEELSPELPRAIQQYGENNALLSKAFGSSDELTQSYNKQVWEALRLNGGDLVTAIDNSALQILPSPLQLISGQPGCDRLLNVALGQKLNAEKLSALEKVCGWKKGPPGPPSPPIVFLGKAPDEGGDDGFIFGALEDSRNSLRFAVHTEDSRRVVTAKDLPKIFKEIGVDRSHVVFSGEILSEEFEDLTEDGSGKTAKSLLEWLKYQVRPPPRHLADTLHRAGVKVVTELGRYARDMANPPANVKFLCILSEEEAVARQLFEGQAVAPVARAAARMKALAKEFPDRVGLFETEKSLTDEIERLRSDGIRPILVHHGTDFIYFGDPPTPVAKLGGDFDDISCETFRVLGLDARTTSFIDIESTTYVLEDAVRELESGRPTFFAGLRFGPKKISAEESHAAGSSSGVAGTTSKGSGAKSSSGGTGSGGGRPPGGGGNAGGDDDAFHAACEREFGPGMLFGIGNAYFYVPVFNSQDDDDRDASGDEPRSPNPNAPRKARNDIQKNHQN